MENERSLSRGELAIIAGMVVTSVFIFVKDGAWFWYVIVLIAGGIIVSVKQKRESTQRLQGKANFAAECENITEFVSCGDYIGGHPDLDKFLWDVKLLRKQSDIEIYATYKDNSDPKLIKVFTGRQSRIPIASIMNINIEDRSARFSRLSVSSIGLQDLKGTGPEEADQNTFLCIDWSNENLNYSTLFQFASFQEADNARNQLINICNTI